MMGRFAFKMLKMVMVQKAGTSMGKICVQDAKITESWDFDDGKICVQDAKMVMVLLAVNDKRPMLI